MSVLGLLRRRAFLSCERNAESWIRRADAIVRLLSCNKTEFGRPQFLARHSKSPRHSLHFITSNRNRHSLTKIHFFLSKSSSKITYLFSLCIFCGWSVWEFHPFPPTAMVKKRTKSRTNWTQFVEKIFSFLFTQKPKLLIYSIVDLVFSGYCWVTFPVFFFVQRRHKWIHKPYINGKWRDLNAIRRTIHSLCPPTA